MLSCSYVVMPQMIILHPQMVKIRVKMHVKNSYIFCKCTTCQDGCLAPKMDASWLSMCGSKILIYFSFSFYLFLHT